MNEDMKAILTRVSALEGEVETLKSQLAEVRGDSMVEVQRMKVVESIPAKEPIIAVKVEPILEPQQNVSLAVPMQKKPKKEIDFEKELGIWLPRVFMFILLLGVLWGLKVGMEYGVITNPVRVGMGYAGTGLLYYLGIRYINNGKKGFGLTLLGGFIALGILTTFAAHHLYGYLNFPMALIVGVAYIVIGLLLSIKTKSETLTIFSAIAGFLLPFLLEGEGATAVQFCLYTLLLFLSLFYVSLSQKHKYTFYVTFLLFHISLLTYGILDGIDGDDNILVGTALIQHLALLFFYLKGSISRQVFSEALIYTNFLFAIGWIKLLDYQQEVYVYGAFAVLYVALAVYFFSKKDELLRGVLSAVAVFAVSVCILSLDFDNEQIKLIFLLINGAIGLWVGLRFDTLRTIVTSSAVYLLTALVILVSTEFYLLLSLEHAVWLVFLGTILWIYYTLYQFVPAVLKEKLERIDRGLIIGQVISLYYIYKVVTILIVNAQLSFETGMHVQILVFIVALCLMYMFYKWKHGVYLTHAVVIEYLLLGLFVIRFSLSSYYADGGFFFNLFVQILYVLILTIMFLAIMKNRFYVTPKSIKIELPQLAIVMQIVYFIFLNKWYFAYVNSHNWSWEYILLVHTFLLFTFAFISISIGRKLNWKHVKIIGVGLIGVCILKLFLVDLASISILIRAILFMVVGVVGLLYSRTLLKD
ncbi:DUF2339 domain-containing protein [Sporosarcina limicola]|uniref:Membrane protein n=1 Tax=Sporosarcina limicola TaxID=34101 RepID=A0A927MKU6_9BACL|nr:DUF2339 domain-containing protein [Sporosarcina limicola]MBE1553046.1 putative membrane protein [Sporosarcina limicola]